MLTSASTSPCVRFSCPLALYVRAMLPQLVCSLGGSAAFLSCECLVVSLRDGCLGVLVCVLGHQTADLASSCKPMLPPGSGRMMRNDMCASSTIGCGHSIAGRNTARHGTAQHCTAWQLVVDGAASASSGLWLHSITMG